MSESALGKSRSNPAKPSRPFRKRLRACAFVLDGGEITEYVPGDPDRGEMLRTGQYFWQDAGVTRAIRNTGTTKVQFAEIELK
jgi:hypothetical protein